MAVSTLRYSRSLDEARVVPGADRVEAERDRAVENRGELDALVAAQARVGRAARGVLGDEVVDDVLAELLGQVPDVERDAQHVGGPARVAGVVEGAASAGAGAERLRILGEREVHGRHVVTRVNGAGSCHGGVHAAGQRGDDLHERLTGSR